MESVTSPYNALFNRLLLSGALYVNYCRYQGSVGAVLQMHPLKGDPICILKFAFPLSMQVFLYKTSEDLQTHLGYDDLLCIC